MFNLSNYFEIVLSSYVFLIPILLFKTLVYSSLILQRSLSILLWLGINTFNFHCWWKSLCLQQILRDRNTSTSILQFFWSHVQYSCPSVHNITVLRQVTSSHVSFLYFITNVKFCKYGDQISIEIWGSKNLTRKYQLYVGIQRTKFYPYKCQMSIGILWRVLLMKYS